MTKKFVICFVISLIIFSTFNVKAGKENEPEQFILNELEKIQ